jgi:hypothetical protein
MYLKDNPRLVELRTACILNNIVNIDDRDTRTNILRLIKAMVVCENKEDNVVFDNLLINSANDLLLGASKNELYLMVQVFYSNPSQYCKKLGMSKYEFDANFIDNLSYITKEKIDNLEPKYAMLQNYFDVCNKITNFVETLKLSTNSKSNKFKSKGRHLEFMMYFILKDLTKFYGSEEKARNLILQLSIDLKINLEVINYVLTDLDKIFRGYDNYIHLNKRLVKELTNFASIENIPLSRISEDVLHKSRNYLNATSAKKSYAKVETTDIYFANFYTPTILLDNFHTVEVERLVKAFEDFNYAEL